MDTEESRQELWHRLNNESGRAYEAFKAYMYLPPAERTIVGAWRLWSDNPDAGREPPYFQNWARNFAWSERARAHDHHIELIRERGMEKAIEEEAARQARQVEQVRFRYNELLAGLFERAMQWIEDSDWTRGDLRAADVVKIAALHADAVDKLVDTNPQGVEGDWEEDDDDEIGRRIVEEVDAAAEARCAEEDDPEPEEGLPDEDEAEEA